MIKRIKKEGPFALFEKKWDGVKKDALIQKNHHSVVLKCYRETTMDKLLELYERKCAYCERRRGTEINVDHYRPKKQRNKLTNKQYNQPGYYWLPYEWSNLLPLCSKCNQYKSNKFPLMDWSEVRRISTNEDPVGTPDDRRFLLAYLNDKERPLILNPEHEALEFFQHFAFNENGRIAGKTSKGKETIVLCNLDRKDLRIERKELILEYVGLIKDEIFKYTTRSFANAQRDILLQYGLEIAFNKIKSGRNSSKEFSLLSWYAYRYFDHIILPHISGNKSKQLIKNSFLSYKNINP